MSSTDGADRASRPVGDDLASAPSVLCIAQSSQGFSSRAQVEILFGVVGEDTLWKEVAASPSGLVQPQVGTDACLLYASYVLYGFVFAITGDVVRLSFHRKAVRHSRASMGRFSVTSPGVTSTERIMQDLPPSMT